MSARSSVGQSNGFLIRGSQVQVLPGALSIPLVFNRLPLRTALTMSRKPHPAPNLHPQRVIPHSWHEAACTLWNACGAAIMYEHRRWRGGRSGLPPLLRTSRSRPIRWRSARRSVEGPCRGTGAPWPQAGNSASNMPSINSPRTLTSTPTASSSNKSSHNPPTSEALPQTGYRG